MDGYVTLHKDAITLQSDIHGLDSLKEYCKSYFDNYSYTHYPLVDATNPENNTVFSFAVDKVRFRHAFRRTLLFAKSPLQDVLSTFTLQYYYACTMYCYRCTLQCYSQ